MPFSAARAPSAFNPSTSRFHSSSVKARLSFEDGNVLPALDRMSLFRRADDPRPHREEKIAVREECFLHILVRLGREKRAEPRVADRQAAQVQVSFQHLRVPGVLVSDLAALITGQRHLGNALFKGIAPAELGQVVVGPCDRRDTKPHIFLLHLFLLELPLELPRRFDFLRDLPGRRLYFRVL